MLEFSRLIRSVLGRSAESSALLLFGTAELHVECMCIKRSSYGTRPASEDFLRPQWLQSKVYAPPRVARPIIVVMNSNEAAFDVSRSSADTCGPNQLAPSQMQRYHPHTIRRAVLAASRADSTPDTLIVRQEGATAATLVRQMMNDRSTSER